MYYYSDRRERAMGNIVKKIAALFRNIRFLGGDSFNRNANSELYLREQNLKRIESERERKEDDTQL